ncbi:MAG: YncE family protein, partial [Phycisphaerae bacterium]|nr:YncE family protein [Gemmatimonadaceae bacterium]
MSRAVALAILCISGTSLAAQQRATGTIIASNMNAASVSILDVASGTTLATVATGNGPHEVAVSHSGKWAVVA